MNAATAASNLSESELTLGDVGAAIRDGERAVAHADRSGNAGRRTINRTTHADAWHQAGQRAAAEARFVEAEAMQAEVQPDYPAALFVGRLSVLRSAVADAERAAWQRLLMGQEQSRVSNPTGPKRRHVTLTRATALATTLLTNSMRWINACHSVSERAKHTPALVTPQTALLDIGLDHLTLACARALRSDLARRTAWRRASE